MKLRAKLLLPAVAILFLLSAVIGVGLKVALGYVLEHQHETSSALVGRSIEDQLQQYTESVDEAIDRLSDRALSQAAMLAMQPEVLAAYREANAGNINDPMDAGAQSAREQLRTWIAPVLTGFSEYSGGTLKVHYHLKNARSLVRLWRDGWNAKVDGVQVDVSDDLSSFRQTVVQINQLRQQPIRGIEIGRGGFAIRGLAPISDPAGEHLGSVEVLYPFSDVFSRLSELKIAGAAVYMNSEHLETARNLQDPEAYPQLSERYVRCGDIRLEAMGESLTVDLLDKAKNKLAFGVYPELTVAAWPITDFSGQQVGIVAIGLDTSEHAEILQSAHDTAEAQNNLILYWLIGGILVSGLVLAGLLAYLLRITVLKPLGALLARLLDISEGEGDLARRIEEKQSDEFGDIGRAFNRFMDKIQQLVVATKGVADDLSTAMQDIDLSTKQIHRKMAEQTDQVTSASSAVEQLSTSAEQSSERGQRVSGMTQQARTKAQDGGDRVQETIRLIGAISDGAKASSSTMQALGDRVEAIGELIGTIDDIAEQTNLLALNAAIEAARAGEHGRGFAVVADEVRKLADRTSAATTEVATAIHSIQGDTRVAIDSLTSAVASVDEGVASAELSGQSLLEIVSQTDALTAEMGEVAVSAREETEATNQIAGVMDVVSTLSQQALDATAQSTKTMAQLTRKCEQLEDMLSRFNLSAPDRRLAESAVPKEIEERRLNMKDKAREFKAALAGT